MSPPASRSTTRWAAHGRCRARSTCPGRALRAVPRPASRRARRRRAVLRRPGRRRPAHADGGPHRFSLRRAGPHLHRGGRAAARGRPCGRRCRARRRDRRASNDRPPWSSTPPASGRTTSARCRGPRTLPGAGQQGRPPRRPADRIAGEAGLILRTDRSVLFVIPWGQHWIVGTTDTDWTHDLAHPAATAQTSTSSSTRSTVLATPLHP